MSQEVLILFVSKNRPLTFSFCLFLVSEMTYTVSSGTLNSSIPYHTFCLFRSSTSTFIAGSSVILCVHFLASLLTSTFTYLFSTFLGLMFPRSFTLSRCPDRSIRTFRHISCFIQFLLLVFIEISPFLGWSTSRKQFILVTTHNLFRFLLWTWPKNVFVKCWRHFA